jgi:transposase
MGNKPSDIPIGEFVRLALAGLTDDQIAEELHIGTASLSRWKKRHGIMKKGKDAELYHTMQKYGYSDKEIARRWGISSTALYLWKKGKGLV